MTASISGLEEVQRNLQRKLEQAGGPMTERFVTEVLIAVGARAATYTPVATSTLINSQYRRLRRAQKGWIGETGYGAEYAMDVHEAEGTLLNTNTPRSPSRLGTVWGPNGQPGFLAKGVEEAIEKDIDAIIKRSFNL